MSTIITNVEVRNSHGTVCNTPGGGELFIEPGIESVVYKIKAGLITRLSCPMKYSSRPRAFVRCAKKGPA